MGTMKNEENLTAWHRNMARWHRKTAQVAQKSCFCLTPPVPPRFTLFHTITVYISYYFKNPKQTLAQVSVLAVSESFQISRPLKKKKIFLKTPRLKLCQGLF